MKHSSLIFGCLFIAVSLQANAQGLSEYVVKSVNATPTSLSLSKSDVVKKIPITVDEPIDKAPAGTTFENLIRSGFSFYVEGGYVYGSHNDGFIGEYVIGDDGCIYIKNPFASLDLGTYLKLDKVDDETYVARTAQLVWVDYSEYTPFTGFATRLVYKDLGGQLTYEVAEDQNTDMYFTLKDGVLQQKNQESVKVGETEYPIELLGVTDSDGGWLGFGDGNMVFYASKEKPTALPEGAKVTQGSIVYNVLSSRSGKNNKDATLVKYAEVGDDFYLESPFHDDVNTIWMKGAIDRNANTVTFEPQYLGVNKDIACHQWLKTASFYDWFELIDEEVGYGVWHRNYDPAASYVFKYENGNLISDTTNMKQTLVISRSPEKLEASAVISNAIVKPYIEKSAIPAKPSIVEFSEFNGLYGYVTFSLPCVDTDDVYMNPDNMSYSLFVDSEDRYTFKTSEYWSLPEDTQEIGYFYDDDMDFDPKANGYHTVFFYEDWQFVGVQSIQRFDGNVNYSEIDWYNHIPSGIETATTEEKVNVSRKMIKDGKLIIINDGKVYNAAGQRIK